MHINLKYFLKVGLFAVASFITSKANAAFSYQPGNLYLGIGQIGNSTSDFAVNIGAGGTYRDALSPIQLTLTNLNTTLNGIFGNGWQTNPTVRWGIFGTTYLTANNGDPRRVLYTTQPIGATAPLQASSQTAVASEMINAINYYSNGAATGTISNLTESAVANGAIGAPGNANSVTTQLFSGVPFADSDLAPGYSLITTNLQLFRVPQTADGAVVKLGTFSISGDVLTYTAVPEPSTYALVGGALVALGLVAHKRRKLASACR